MNEAVAGTESDMRWQPEGPAAYDEKMKQKKVLDKASPILDIIQRIEFLERKVSELAIAIANLTTKPENDSESEPDQEPEQEQEEEKESEINDFEEQIDNMYPDKVHEKEGVEEE